MPQAPIEKDEIALLRWLDGLDSESVAGRREAIGTDTWERSIEFFRGKRQFGNETGAKFSANITAASIERKNALLTENKPIIKIQSVKPGLLETTKVLNQTINAGWDAYNMPDVLETSGFDTGIFGCTFLTINYDPMANYGLGDIVVAEADPRNVRFDPTVVHARDLDQAEYVIFDGLESLRKIQEKFPVRGAMVKPDPRVSLVRAADGDTGGGSFAASLRRTFRLGQSELQQAIDRAFIRTYYFRDPRLDSDGRPLYPNGRRVIRGGENTILDDRANIYWDEGWPVVMMDGHYDPEHPYGRSDVVAVKKIQQAINRIGHAFVENTILTGNVWVTADADALPPDVKQRLTNLGAVILEKKFGRSLTREPPPAMPPHMMEFMKFGIGLCDLLIGLSDGGMDSKGRVELRSGAQLEGLQAAAQILVRAQARRLESMLQRLGQKWISRIFQFYTSDRILAYVGANEDWDQFQFERQNLIGELTKQASGLAQEEWKQKGGQGSASIPETKKKIEELMMGAWKNFRFHVTPGSSIAASKIQRAQLWGQLAQNMIAPRTKVLEELGEQNPKELIAQAMEEVQTMGPPNPPKGKAGGKKGGLG